jgi:3-dehydroquinate dehydratase
MLDEKDLQAIAALMDSKIRESENRMMVMMESYFDPKFQALSEQINPVPKEAIDILEDRVDDLEKAVELHTQQINELKKAQ